MACYHPIPAYQGGPGEKPRLWPPVGTATLKLPCGSCLGCRTDHATDWAHRAENEASSWDHNCFVTLTYDDDHLPEHGHLRPRDLRNFIKRVRQAVRRTYKRSAPAIASVRPIGPRYLGCGEYGDRTNRPHYHVLLFNCAFTDSYVVAKGLRESPTLAKYWELGGHRIGELTGASANYVAQYSLKKLGHPVERHDQNGEVYQEPFIRMSLKPPIGQRWTEKYKEDLQHGYLIRNARKKRIPRAMKKQLAKLDPQLGELATYNAMRHSRVQHDLTAAELIHQSKNNLFHSRTL